MNLELVPFLIISILAFIHWVADFVFQTDTMAKNKSTSWKWLAAHILTYGAVLFSGVFFSAMGWAVTRHLLTWGSMSLTNVLGMAIFYGAITGIYTLINMVLHATIDAITSRITSRLYREGKTHQFFVVIGIDQFLHLLCLIWTFAWITVQ